jgi:hypothetical protein
MTIRHQALWGVYQDLFTRAAFKFEKKNKSDCDHWLNTQQPFRFLFHFSS